MTASQDSIQHDAANNRYVVQFHDGGEGELVYQREGELLRLVHSQVPTNRRGAGLGARLMENALAAIETEHLKVQPVCRYTQHYIDRHERWQSLLA